MPNTAVKAAVRPVDDRLEECGHSARWLTFDLVWEGTRLFRCDHPDHGVVQSGFYSF